MLDAHLHLCDETLYPEADLLIAEALENNVTQFLCVVTNHEELQRGLLLKAKYPMLKLAASTTPHEAITEEDPFFKQVEHHAIRGDLDAIGETGLEYFHPGLNKGLQRAYLNRYVQLAIRCKLPLIFHCREGFRDLFDYLKPFRGQFKGMIHCFTGSYDEAEEGIALGLFISLSGIVTFKNARGLQTAVEALPIEALLIETDCPYLAPLSKRGQVNRPKFIQETYEKVASLKNMPVHALEEQVKSNYTQFFCCHKNI